MDTNALMNAAGTATMDTTLAEATVWLAAFTAFMVLATFILAFVTHRSALRQIGVQTWLELGKRFDSPEMEKARATLAKMIRTYTPTEDKHREISEAVPNFFEDLGSAYRHGYINKKLARDTFGYFTCRWWEVLKPYVDYERRRHKEDRTIFADFEKLAQAVRLPSEVIDEDELNRFRADENNLAVV